MSLALALAAALAALNILLGRLSSRPGPWSNRREAAGFALRLVVLFGGAHGLWLRRHAPAEVAVFIVACALLQMTGLVALHLAGPARAGG